MTFTMKYNVFLFINFESIFSKISMCYRISIWRLYKYIYIALSSVKSYIYIITVRETFSIIINENDSDIIQYKILEIKFEIRVYFIVGCIEKIVF